MVCSLFKNKVLIDHFFEPTSTVFNFLTAILLVLDGIIYFLILFSCELYTVALIGEELVLIAIHFYVIMKKVKLILLVFTLVFASCTK
jgi:hypothetical protein